MNKEEIKFLEEKAAEIRRVTVEMIGRLGVGHVGGALSICDLLSVLYYKYMKVEPKNPQLKDRDRLVISKGHAGPALYSVLAIKGFFDMENIKTLNRPKTILPSHCDMNKTPGVDMTAGSLGQGLSCAVGMALAAKLDKTGNKVFCIIGDGESQEGQIYEALMYAGNKKLDNLIIFLDNNKMQIDGYTDDINSIEPFDKKAEAFNLYTQRINGNSVKELCEAIDKCFKQDKCSLIIMDTVKGFGWDTAIEKKVGSHSFSINECEWRSFCGKEEK